MNRHAAGPRKQAVLQNGIKVLASISVAACLAVACPGKQEPPQVLGAFAVLLPGANDTTIAHARVVVDGADAECPALSGSNSGAAPTAHRRHNPDKQLFPVTVCEAAISFGESYTVSGGPTLAAVRPDPASVLAYGDTGCKSGQTCADRSDWPFPVLAAAGVGLAPDLILHMGDYNYRGTPDSVTVGGVERQVYDGGDHDKTKGCGLENPYYSENATDSTGRDDWQNWWLDFFEPAADLLPVAPWVFTRGNHELCSRAGPGWFYFLDAGSNLPGAASPQRSCHGQDDTTSLLETNLAQLEPAAPYVIDLGMLRIPNLDSSNACDLYAPATTTALYSSQFDALTRPLADDGTAFFMTHRPLWAVKKASETINQTLQSALADSKTGALPGSIELSLSGHMHLFESLTFLESGRPPQIVVGNSGVKLAGVIEASDDANTAAAPKTSCIAQTSVDGAEACGNSAAQFGFLSLELQPDATWSGTVFGPDETVVGTCSVPGSPACTLSSQVCTCPPASPPPQRDDPQLDPRGPNCIS